MARSSLFAPALITDRLLQGFLQCSFAIWLWSLLFARVPLAAIQDIFGFESRPLLLLDIVSVCFALLAFNQVRFKPLQALKDPILFAGVLSFVCFWLFYVLRLGFDQWIVSVEMIKSAPALLKDLLTSTLLPALCLPWIVSVASWSSSLALLVGLGSLSLLLGELGFIYLNGIDSLMKLRFAFVDLNPIPAAHSSASLVIISGVLLLGVFYQRGQPKHFSSVFLACIGLVMGLLGLQMAMTKGAFLALVPFAIYASYFLWRHSPRFVCIGFLAVLASISAVMLGAMRRNLLSVGSVGDRFELLKQSLEIWSDNLLLGVGFRSQTLLAENILTVKSHWYPHNLFAETFLIGGMLLVSLTIVFVVCAGLASSFDSCFHCSGDVFHLSLAFLWIQGLVSALFSGHLALIPGFWLGGLMVLWNRYR